MEPSPHPEGSVLGKLLRLQVGVGKWGPQVLAEGDLEDDLPILVVRHELG